MITKEKLNSWFTPRVFNQVEEKHYDCQLCKDTGEVSSDVMDSEGNWESGAGFQTCVCRYRDDLELEQF